MCSRNRFHCDLHARPRAVVFFKIQIAIPTYRYESGMKENKRRRMSSSSFNGFIVSFTKDLPGGRSVFCCLTAGLRNTSLLLPLPELSFSLFALLAGSYFNASVAGVEDCIELDYRVLMTTREPSYMWGFRIAWILRGVVGIFSPKHQKIMMP